MHPCNAIMKSHAIHVTDTICLRFTISRDSVKLQLVIKKDRCILLNCWNFLWPDNHWRVTSTSLFVCITIASSLFRSLLTPARQQILVLWTCAAVLCSSSTEARKSRNILVWATSDVLAGSTGGKKPLRRSFPFSPFVGLSGLFFFFSNVSCFLVQSFKRLLISKASSNSCSTCSSDNESSASSCEPSTLEAIFRKASWVGFSMYHKRSKYLQV